MAKVCVLYERTCNNCGECDYCNLNPLKLCDNCGRCIEPDKEFREIKIDSVITDNHKNARHDHCDCGCHHKD